MSNDSQRDNILAKMDVQSVFEESGVLVAKGAIRDENGYLRCHSLYNEDKNPSATINVGNGRQRGIYHDFILGLTKSVFDIAAESSGYPFMTGKEAFYYFGKLTGVLSGNSNKSEKVAPTMGDVTGFQKNVSPETKDFLRDKRGLTEDSLTKYRVGWCLKRQRNAFPVFDETGALVNIRFHNSKKDPKTLNWSGYGGARLWGLDRLAKAAPGITVLLTEGEFDAMLAEQETGFLAVSGTNGAKSFQAGWVKHFHGFHVVLLYDSDQAGREAVQNLVLPVFKPAVLAGDVLSIKVVWLYDKPDKGHKDFTDYIIKDGGSGAKLKDLIRLAEPQTFPTPISHLETPTILRSFELIDRAKYAGRRVTMPIQIFGENTVAYHAPAKFTVASCPLKRDNKCTGREGHAGACMAEVVVPLGERILIAGVRATDGQLLKNLRAYICDKDRSPALTIKDEDKITIREVYSHQVVGAMAAERIELVEKPVYVIGGGLVEIGKYQATGRVVTSYRDQQPTMLIDTLERLEEDYQGFTVEKYRPSLEKLRVMTPREIADDLAVHVTRIYERPDLHLGVLMVLCSPLGFDFPGEGQIRGWLTAIIVGDTGTGKTTVSEGFFNFARIGSRVSGMTASRTGITYGCEHDERRGWRIKAGVLLKMNRQALIVDEAQDIAQEELKTMAEGIDTGLLRINKIQNKIFECRTRVIFGCNPKSPKQASDQRTMDSFRYGCEAIKGIFPGMMIRRIDFAMFAATWDIEDKEKIYFPEIPDTPQQVTDEDLRALIFFAWNLKPEQIVIDDKTAHYIRQQAKYLSDKFGGSDDLPIVYSEDFRKTMARLSVAMAIIDLATTDDFSQVIVNLGHVSDACELMERIYEARNCKLDEYAKNYRQTHGIEGAEEMAAEIDAKMVNTASDERIRFHHIFYELLNCPDNSRVRKSDLADEFDVKPTTIQSDIRFFRDNHLIDPSVQKGYKPEPRFFQVWDFLRRRDREKYRFDVAYKKIFV
jgi:hypothetical protein